MPELNQALEEQLRDALRKLEETENRATHAEQQGHKLEDCLSLARNDLGKWMEAKVMPSNNEIT